MRGRSGAAPAAWYSCIIIPDDRITTKRLVEAGKLLGIPVIDHIIIGDGVYVSMKKEGMLSEV